MKGFSFLALIALTALLSASCININYNYYEEDNSEFSSDVEIISYETKEEKKPEEEVEKEETSAKESLPADEDTTANDGVYETAEESTAAITEAIDTEPCITEDIQTTAPETEQEISGIPMWISSLTSPISSNQTATLVAIGKPSTEYTISVYYKTTQSTAQGLEPKISNEDGRVSWSWKIGASVKTGRYKIVVSGGGETIETEIQVYGK